MGLTVTVLGCSGSYPGPGAACSGYLLRGGSATVLLDAGSGTLANLQRHVGLDEIDAVVLSHEHPDHRADVDGLQVALAYGLQRFGLPVYAPASVAGHSYAFNRPSLDFRPVTDGGTAEVGAMRFTFSRTDHGPETLAAMIEVGDHRLVYTADTGDGWSATAFGRRPDVLLAEATYSAEQAEQLVRDEGRVPGHLTGALAGAMAADCGAGSLVLTHLWPGNDVGEAVAAAAATFDGPVTAARENESFRVEPPPAASGARGER